MSFKVNDKVVCVDDCFSPCQVGVYSSFPKEGVVYTVEGYDGSFDFAGITEAAVWVVGIRGFKYRNTTAPFRASRFRKLEDIQAENREREEEAAKLKEALELINLY